MQINQTAQADLASKDRSILRRKISEIHTWISGRRQTFRSVLALSGSNIATSVLTAAGGLLVARFLGPEETGPFRAFTIPLTYLMFLHMGTFDGLWRQIPYYVGKGMPERVDAVASTAGAFNLFLSGVVSFGFICCATYSLLRHDLYGVFGWLSQAFFCWEVFYGGYLTSTYRTLHHFVTMSKIQIAQSIFTFGMVFLLPFLRFYGLCTRVALSSFLVVWLYHRARPLNVIYRFNKEALSELIKIGLPFNLWGSIETNVWVATEGALVLSLGGVTALGLFSVAYAIRGAMNSLPSAVVQVLTPRVVAALARDGSIRNANARVMWVTVGLTGFMVVIAIIGSSLLDIFVPHVIPKYVDGIPVMKICLWFPVVRAAFLPINVFFATGKTWLYGRGVIAGIVVFPLTTLLLYPSFSGLLAVAVGSLLGRTARTLAGYLDLIVLARREK